MVFHILDLAKLRPSAPYIVVKWDIMLKFLIFPESPLLRVSILTFYRMACPLLEFYRMACLHIAVPFSFELLPVRAFLLPLDVPLPASCSPSGANVKHHLSLRDSGGLRLLLNTRLLAFLLAAARRPPTSARAASSRNTKRRML